MLILKRNILWLLFWVMAASVPTLAQETAKPEKSTQPQVKDAAPAALLRKEYTQEKRFGFSYARGLKIYMPPVGNISIEGWSKRELTIQAKIVVEAKTEADLEILAQNTGFALSTDAMTWVLASIGPQAKMDRKKKKEYDKQVPGRLQKIPYRIDYVLRVPDFTDLEIEQMQGDLSIGNVYGGLNFNIHAGKATLYGLGGVVVGRIANGEALVVCGGPTWRGSGLNLQLGVGNIELRLPTPYAADLTLAATQQLKIAYTIPPEEGEDLDAPFGNVLQKKLNGGGPSMLFSTKLGQIQLVSTN